MPYQSSFYNPAAIEYELIIADGAPQEPNKYIVGVVTNIANQENPEFKKIIKDIANFMHMVGFEPEELADVIHKKPRGIYNQIHTGCDQLRCAKHIAFLVCNFDQAVVNHLNDIAEKLLKEKKISPSNYGKFTSEINQFMAQVKSRCRLEL